MDEAAVALADYKSSYRHLAWSFRRSRDKWKAKHQQLKRQHKRLQNQLRAVTASRERHKQAAHHAEQRVAQLHEQIDRLQDQHAAASGEKGG
jgi:chromosome segregation ATPase